MNTACCPKASATCSWRELADRFCRFQASDRRPELCRRLQEMLNSLRLAKVAHELLINGSFVTSKAQPNDIDLIVVLADRWDFQADLRPDIYNLLSKKRVRDRWGF